MIAVGIFSVSEGFFSMTKKDPLKLLRKGLLEATSFESEREEPLLGSHFFAVEEKCFPEEEEEVPAEVPLLLPRKD